MFTTTGRKPRVTSPRRCTMSVLHAGTARPWMRGAAVVTVAVMAAVVDPAAGRATRAHTTGAEAMLAQARLLHPATGASFSALPSPVLGGFTRQGWPVVAQMASDGSIARIGIGLEMRCTSGDQFALNDFAIRVPIGARGKV